MLAISTTRTATTGRTPSFWGVTRGELFKISRLRSTTIMAIIGLGIAILPWFALAFIPRQRAAIVANTVTSMLNNVEGNLSLMRVLLGIFLIILAVQVIGMDYQQGTIRIILARGVERLQLLGAKALALLIVSGIALAGWFLWELILGTVTLSLVGSGFGLFSALNATFWNDTGLYAITVVVSALASVALAVAATVLGRSVAFGMAVGLGFFPVDNFGTLILRVIAAVTNNTFWAQVTRYLLGPALNSMPVAALPQTTHIVATPTGPVSEVSGAFSFGISPLYTDNFVHTLLVVLVYVLAFAALAIVLTWRRDVKE